MDGIQISAVFGTGLTFLVNIGAKYYYLIII